MMMMMTTQEEQIWNALKQHMQKLEMIAEALDTQQELIERLKLEVRAMCREVELMTDDETGSRQ